LAEPPARKRQTRQDAERPRSGSQQHRLGGDGAPDLTRCGADRPQQRELAPALSGSERDGAHHHEDGGHRGDATERAAQ
jgi:hypothetical protein